MLLRTSSRGRDREVLSPPPARACRSCVAKEYHYHVCTGPVSSPFRRSYAFYKHHALDWDAMQARAPPDMIPLPLSSIEWR